MPVARLRHALTASAVLLALTAGLPASAAALVGQPAPTFEPATTTPYGCSIKYRNPA